MSDDRRLRLSEDDATARREAQREFTRPLVVEAGAGTGKTSILVARMIAWSLGPGWERAAASDPSPALNSQLPPDPAPVVAQGLVAVTFTEAAAAEMAERLATGLAAIARGDAPIGVDAASLPPPDTAAERARRLGAELFRVRVRTIHSLCASLLQSYPVEADLHPGFRVDEGGLAAEAAALEVVEQASRTALGEPPDPRWLRLAALGIGPRRLAAAVTALARSGATPALVARDPFAAATVAELLRELERRLAAFTAAEGGRLQGAVGASRTVAASREVAALAAAVTAASRDAAGVSGVVALISGKNVERLAAWGKGDFNKSEAAAVEGRADAVQEAAAELAPLLARLAELRVEPLVDATAVVGELFAATAEQLRAEGVVTFDTLLVATRALLRDHPWLARELRTGIAQLLVDEFQDTDAVQCDIVRLLALSGPPAERPGLFIVGDPKQSIYGWRNADLRAYDAFVAELLAAGGVRHRLSVNYRSVPAILAEVARVVDRVMVAEEGLQPAFEPLLACPERAADPGEEAPPWSPVEHWVSWPGAAADGSGPGTSGEALEIEAKALARDLVALHARGRVAWKQVAVLLRSTTEIDTVLDQLRASGVPYAVARDRDYYRRREVVEAAALVRVILDPSDQLALLTLLRADWVGVPDAALIPLWAEGFCAAMAELDGRDPAALAALRAVVDRAAARVPGWVPELERLRRWPAALAAAVATVAALRRSFVDDAPDRFCERLRAQTAVEATAAARYLGHYRRARLDRFFSELERQLVEGDGGRAGLGRFLRRAVEEGYETTEASPAAQLGDAVQVMTMHRAKGLDFEHVYVLQLHRGAGGGTAKPAEMVQSGGASAVRLFGWPSPAAMVAELWAGRVARAEQVRLLYVAMTRARRRLVLGGAWPGGVRRRGGSSPLVDLVADDDALAALAAQLEAGVERRREGAVQWVLPGLSSEAAAHVEGVATPSGAAAAVVAAEARALDRRRQEARVSSARPWSQGASALAAHATADDTDNAPDHTSAGERLDAELPAERPRPAAVVGTLIHHLLETLELGRALAPQLAERAPALRAALARELGADAAGAADHLERLLARLAGGRCLARLEELAERVVARELAVLAPPAPPSTAVGFVSGRVDLVYRLGDELVVVDFKTDAVADDAAVAARSALYRPQLEVYLTALADGLGLPRRPRAELWFLAADEIVSVE